MSAALHPLDDRIVARELTVAAPQPGALWRPEQTGRPTRAEVIAVGPGRRTDGGAVIPPPAQVGEVVLLAEFGPTEIEVDGEVLLCAPPSMVLAVER